jgi:hypothetical protein
MRTIAAQVDELRRCGAIVTALPSSKPVVHTISARESADILAGALQRTIERNNRVIATSPPFLHGRDERLMERDEFGRIKAKESGGSR